MLDATGRRLLAAGAVGAYWSLYELEAERALAFLPEAIREFFHGDASMALGFGALFALGLYVGRLWALVVPLVPLFFLGVLQIRGYRAPYSEAEPPLTNWPDLLLILGIPIGLGVLIRTAWDRVGAWLGARTRTSTGGSR